MNGLKPSNDDLISDLENSFIFTASLSSKELFHSNFLAWLLNKYKTSLLIFDIEALGDTDPYYRIVTEEKNIDLTVKKNGKPIVVIENKFKDIPRAEQLKTYEKKYKDVKTFILLTLVPASFDTAPWRQLTYKDLAKKLEAWVKDKGPSNEDFDGKIIRSYIKMVQNISCLTEEFLQNHAESKDPSYWFEENFDTEIKHLKSIRFDDTIKKLLAAKFVDDFTENIPDCHKDKIVSDTEKNAVEDDIGVTIGFSLNNKTPCVTVGINKQFRKGAPLIRLIIQIQGKQYRRMIAFTGYKIPSGKSIKRKDYDFESAIKKTDNHDWIFADRDDKKFVKAEFLDKKYWIKTNQSNNYGAYNPDNIYRYLNISAKPNTDDEIGYSDLLSYIKSDLELAIKLLQDANYTSRFEDFSL